MKDTKEGPFSQTIIIISGYLWWVFVVKEFRRKSALGRWGRVCASNERYRSGARHGGWRPGKGGNGGVLTPCEVKGRRKDGVGGRRDREGGQTKGERGR